MTLTTEQEAENFLWSLVQGFDGSGWQNYRNTDTNQKLIRIREQLKYHVHSDTYDRHCNATCRDMTNCFQSVPVDQKTCHHHNERLLDR